MTLRLQTESPADQDMFRGSSHEKVAENVAQIIRTPDVNIIGLEGELGSGKSTILKFLQKKLKDDFTFINFDAERYHHGSTKKALIDVIHHGVSLQCPGSRDVLDKYKNLALGNIVEYDKRVSSRLSWLTVVFILLSLLSVQMLRYVLTDLNQYFTNKESLLGWLFYVEVAAFLSPAIMVAGLACLQNMEWYRKKGYSSIGDLFKRNSTDRIEETWLVNKEVGAIELAEALQGFTSKEVISHGDRFILIIDNLDRISADKVKELWSDMELIAGATHEHFRIVVPYSARQVSASLSVAGFSGREFIAKRIPVSFQVPPLISAGWQEALRQYWKETVNEDAGIACREATVLLERWKPSEYPRITPRLMKKFVNDIHILNLTVPATEDHRHILIALYLLVVRYGERDIKVLLRDPKASQTEPGIAPDDFDEMLSLTYQQISRIFNNDTERWSEFLMSIHYQSTVELARSELLDTPLKDAIGAINIPRLEELTALWGFAEAWQRVAPHIQMRDWLVSYSRMDEKCQALAEPQLKVAVQMLNQSYAVSLREKNDEGFVLSLQKLMADGRISLEPFVERQISFIVSKLDEIQDSEKLEAESTQTLLQEADSYSVLAGESLLNKMENFVDGVFYVEYLVNNEETLSNLKIGTLDIGNHGREEMLRYGAEQPQIDLFNPGIIRHINIASKAVQNVIGKNDGTGGAQVSSAIMTLKNRQVVEDVIHFRKIVLSPDWNNNVLNQYYLNNTATRNLFPAEFAAQAVAHMVLHGNYAGIESYSEHIGEERFDLALAAYLRYLRTAESIFIALKDKNVLPYIKNAVGRIVDLGLLVNIPVLSFVKGQYDVIKEATNATSLLIFVRERQKALSEKIIESDVNAMGPVFLHDVYQSGEQFDILKKKLNALACGVFSSSERLIECFTVLPVNMRFILEQMQLQGQHIRMEGSVGIFASWFRDAEPDVVTNAENIHFLWSCLDDTQRETVLDELHDVLLERHIRIDSRIAIITRFHNELSFIEPEKAVERRAIAALFSASVDNVLLSQWLDRQTLVMVPTY